MAVQAIRVLTGIPGAGCGFSAAESLKSAARFLKSAADFLKSMVEFLKTAAEFLRSAVPFGDFVAEYFIALMGDNNYYGCSMEILEMPGGCAAFGALGTASFREKCKE